jgi:hypothetical protein
MFEFGSFFRGLGDAFGGVGDFIGGCLVSTGVLVALVAGVLLLLAALA